jgi:hypothetical protein
MFDFSLIKTQPPIVSFGGKEIGCIAEDGIEFDPKINFIDIFCQPFGKQPVKRFFLGKTCRVTLGIIQLSEQNIDMLFIEDSYNLINSNIPIGTAMDENAKTSGQLIIEPMHSNIGRLKVILKNAVIESDRPIIFTSDKELTLWVSFTAFPDSDGYVMDLVKL